MEDVSLTGKLMEITSSLHRKLVEKLRALVQTGADERAVHVKRQLQACTLSATYRGQRVAACITGYNDLLVLDFDNLSLTALEHCKQTMTADEYVLFAFVSPSGNGLKAGVQLATPKAEALRAELARQGKVPYAELERYHKQMFEWCRERYETICSAQIDASGSDIGRLCFLSYDPEIYINREAIGLLKPMKVKIVPPEICPKAKEGVDANFLNGMLQVEFGKCVSNVQRTLKYEPGQRDTFLYALGNRCYKKGLPEKQVVALAGQQFGGDAGIDVAKIIRNAYTYTTRTDQQETERKKPVAVKLFDFLTQTYEVRRNEVLQRLEFRKKSDPDKQFRPLKRQDYNSIYLDTQFAELTCQPAIVKAVVDSRFARSYNPFEEYFSSLPEWDGETDYIDELAQTIQTTTQEFWRDCFKRWIVGLVACALEEERVNQLALILKGAQGKGKSTWIRHLLPPELKQYYRNGMLDPRNKDHMLLLSQRLLINLEEFEGMRNDSIAELKRLITQDAVTERKAWDLDTDFYIRRASFIASTNEPRFLEDATGTRRFPTVTTEKIDFRTPVNHVGIYSQARSLWKSDFRYWYEEEEFRLLNAHNKHYHLSTTEEELFFVYYRNPLPTDLLVKWMPVSAMLTHISTHGRAQFGNRTIRTLARVLDRDGFNKRLSDNNIWEYEVIQLTLDEVSNGFKSLATHVSEPEKEIREPEV